MVLASSASKADILSIIASRTASELSEGGVQELFPEVLAKVFRDNMCRDRTGKTCHTEEAVIIAAYVLFIQVVIFAMNTLITGVTLH